MTPEYVDDCFNGTLVQANADNKKVAIVAESSCRES